MTTDAKIETPKLVATGDLLGRILAASAYPPDWQISERETEELLRLCNDGLCTTNGDTAPVTVTVRQLLLLLRRHAEARWPNNPVSHGLSAAKDVAL